MTETATDARTTRVVVSRRKEGDDPATLRYDTFDVAVGPRTTILDALVAIRRELDPSLTFRHSCFHASCGTCGMRVDGREGLACVTPVPAGDQVTVEPLGNLPVVSDLVVDMDVFYDEFDAAGRPLIRSSEQIPGAQKAEGIDELERYEDCIECGICLSACPVAGSDPRYVGPAALAASPIARMASPTTGMLAASKGSAASMPHSSVAACSRLPSSARATADTPR